MDSLSLPIPAKRRAVRDSDLAAEVVTKHCLLVVSFGDPAAADYAAYACRDGSREVVVIGDRKLCRRVASPAQAYSFEELDRNDWQKNMEDQQDLALILFLNPRMPARERNILDNLVRFAARRQTGFVGIVSSFRVHLGDAEAAADENFVLEYLRELSARIVVFRPGHVISPHSQARAQLRRCGFCYPLVPKCLHGCFVSGAELFAAIENERSSTKLGGSRRFALLGPTDLGEMSSTCTGAAVLCLDA